MLLVGVGNPMRGDDGAGPEVARRLTVLHVEGLVVATGMEPLALLSELTQPTAYDGVVVVDATAPRADPGRVRVLRESDGSWAVPASPVASHALGLAEVLELARALGLLPPYLTVVGVEGTCFDLGADLSEPVREGVEEAVAVVAGIAAARADRT